MRISTEGPAYRATHRKTSALRIKYPILIFLPPYYNQTQRKNRGPTWMRHGGKDDDMKPENPIYGISMLEAACRTKGERPDFLSPEAAAQVRRFHESLPGYAPTPLVRLDGLARRLGLAGVYVKDESARFGLKAFKGLGGAWALFRLVCEELSLDASTLTLEALRGQYSDRIRDMVFVTATDGNHGKGVSWAAGLLGCESHVYMPKGSVEARAQAIRDAGTAQVTVTELGYDDTVRLAAKTAEERGWYLVQDTSWPGYEKVPAWIVQGYTTMVFEALEQLEQYGIDRPSHVLLQAGVGAMAGGVLGALVCRYGDALPTVSVVEPDEVACVFESALHSDGQPHKATGSEKTIMAGLNCGEPCPLTWPILRDYAHSFFACPDYTAAHGMRTLAAAEGRDSPVVSGESGAVTAGLLALLMEKEELAPYRERLGLDENSVVLLFSTEGDTDPENYEHIVHGGKYPTP